MKPSAPGHSSPVQTLRVWDLPTRLFHWALVLCVASLIVSGLRGGAALEWHLRFGYCTLTLLLFRVVWGIVGGHWSRFVHFFYAPSTILAYLRGQSQPEHEVGHNPLGSLSVWALLLVLGAQVGSGLFSDDEIATTGPLVKFASSQVVSWASAYHTEIGKVLIFVLIFLHVGAVLVYLFKKKQNLITPMLQGDKAVAAKDKLPASQDGAAQRITALVIFAVLAGLVAYGVRYVSQ